MPEEKKKSWFRRHWILTGIGGFCLFFIMVGFFQGISDATKDTIKYSGYSKDGLIIVSSNLLVPQDSEVDRIWKIGDITSITTNATGFIEGAERKINKVESLEATHITPKAYRFNSANNANQFYEQEKEKINVRGIAEWNLGIDCFGVEKDVVLSGYAKGFCLRDNVVFYIESTSSSYSYTSDGKDIMKVMLKKV